MIQNKKKQKVFGKEALIDFDSLRNQPGYVQINDDSLHHWVGYIKSGNPDDPSLMTLANLAKILSAQDIAKYFEPMRFVGWVHRMQPTVENPAGKTIVSPLRKYASYQLIFKIEGSEAPGPSPIPHYWALDDLKNFLGDRIKKTTATKIKELTKAKHSQLAPTKETLAVARKELKRVPYTAKKIANYVMAQSQKLQEEKSWKIIPPEIGKYKNLERLELVSHMFTALPPQIGKLKKLKYLDLSGSRLRTLPPQIGQLKQLETLDLDFNETLISLPPEIGRCKNLAYLSLKNCTNLRSLPSQIKNCTVLKTINLQSCPNRKKIAEDLRRWLPKCKVDALP